MSGKGFKSPLKQREQEQTSKHQDVETLKQQDIKTSKHQDVETLKQQNDIKRMTVYMPTQLARKLKIHASATDQDMSGIITMLVEKYLDKEMD